MANGRMITNQITTDKRVNDLIDDTSRLAFTWLVTFADVEGRTHGDPGVVRSLLFPRRTEPTIEQMGIYIYEWAIAGLVCWYEANGDAWISFPAFRKNQVGLRPEKEARSRIPSLQTEVTQETLLSLLRKTAGVTAEQLPLKLKEMKLREVNLEPEQSFEQVFSPTGEDDLEVQRIFQKVTGMITFPAKDREKAINALYSIRRVHPEIVEYLAPFWKEWNTRGYNKTNLSWLTDWAVTGEMPKQRTKSVINRLKDADGNTILVYSDGTEEVKSDECENL